MKELIVEKKKERMIGDNSNRYLPNP